MISSPDAPLRSSLVTVLRLFIGASLSLTLIAPASGCKKDKDDKSNVPDTSDTANVDGENGEQDTGEPAVVYPEQDPDPAELAAAMDKYLLGHYEDAASIVSGLSDSLTQDSQIRARGIAAAIFALASGQDLAENAQAPAQLAKEQAARLDDPELTQIAQMAMASFHLGVAEYATAQADLDAVKDAESAYSELLWLMHAEALLGQAFEDDKLKHPEKLDEAKAGYVKVFDKASSDVIKARAADGITAVGFYKKDKDLTCEWATKAADLYESVGASDYMKEGPKGSAEALRCG